MTVEIALTLTVIIAMMYVLITEKMEPVIVFFIAVNIFLVTGIISVNEAVAGFSNKAVLTIAVIFVITAAARNSGALDYLVSFMLKRKQSHKSQIFRLFLPTTVLSGFINNTPVVATIASIFTEWGRKHNITLSKYLIPLSYAGIFGGICTLIGTSTNLVVSGLLEQFGYESFSMFQITPYGLPLAIIGMIYIYFFSGYLLPERESSYDRMEAEHQEYILEMYVKEGSEIAGKTIEEAELRNLQGVYLLGIIREDEAITPVNTSNMILEKDTLIFGGEIDRIDDLLEIEGLEIRPESHKYFDAVKRGEASFHEAVISLNSPLIDKTPKEVGFRQKYNAVILAVSRQGERVVKKIGDIKFKPGDILLLIADPEFHKQWERGRDFFQIAKKDNKIRLKRGNSIFVGLLFLTMVVLAALNIKPLLFLGSVTMSIIVLTGIVTLNEIKEAVDLKILIMIALAFGVGKAIENSGTADFLAEKIYGVVDTLPLFWIMVLMYLFVMVMTEIVTNNSAAVITIPIALKIAKLASVEPHSMAILVAIAASAAFLTPIGYQTNLIVYGLGDYRFSDFFKVGLPLSITFMFVTAGMLTYFG
ncbi:MAG: SLC13 family permease [Candidatus Mcinerneyibacterium aminivorans]|uniref:SLC13 family permease n=1 Tax=Candidatus Mcinerneyibacterium aminivorans TaxID=2703815 RepID=A0A5D0M9Y2_9BACT|nr:MAG: SLC13 family permease [Candidatus Mcinerneyibacterium aminivorans]